MARGKDFITQHKMFFTGVAVAVSILTFVFILVFFVWHGFSLFAKTDYETNLYTEVFGVFLSVLISVVIVGGWTEWRARQQLKARLTREAGSRSNDIAISAVEWLREKQWLVGERGLLVRANLSQANLQGADLSNANLRGANLNNANLREVTLDKVELQDATLCDADIRGAYSWDANLQGATMWNVKLQGARLGNANLQNASLDCARLEHAQLLAVNLQGATLYRANLQRADLRKAMLQEAYLGLADLQEANLWEANLQEADLFEASLRGVNMQNAILTGANLWKAELLESVLGDADLQGANLRNANLQEAQFAYSSVEFGQIVEKVAILPDGTNFTMDVNLEKFTNPDHPEFKATLEKINQIRMAMNLDPILPA